MIKFYRTFGKTKNITGKMVFHQLAENLQGGRPSEKIMLNIRTFKKI